MEDENRGHITTHFSSTTRRQTPAVPTPNWDNEPIPISRNDSRRHHEADKRKSVSLQSIPSKVKILEDMVIDSSNPKQLINDTTAVPINKKSILTKNHAKNPIYLQHPKSHEPSQIKKGFPFTFFVDSDELGHKQQGSNISQKLKPTKNPIIPLNSDSNVIPTKNTNKQFFLAATLNNNTQNVSGSSISNNLMTNHSVSSMGIHSKNFNLNNVSHKTVGKIDQYNKAVHNNESRESNIQVGRLDSEKETLHIDIPISKESRLKLPKIVDTASESINNRLISPTNVTKPVESNISFHRITTTHDVRTANVEILSPSLESIRHAENFDSEKVTRIQETKFETVSSSEEMSKICMKTIAGNDTLSKTLDIMKMPTTPARIGRRSEALRNTDSSIAINETNYRTPLITQIWSDRKEVQVLYSEKNPQMSDKAQERQTMFETPVGTMPSADILPQSNLIFDSGLEKWRAENYLTGSSKLQMGQGNSIKYHPMPDNVVMSPFNVRTPLRSSTIEATAETRINKEIISEQCRHTPLVDASNRSDTPSVISYHQTPKPFIPFTPKRIAGEVALTPSNSAYTPSFNPHSSMVPLTPIASGPSQAKNSIKLQNCVSTVSLGCELKLLEIYCRTRFSEYNPSRFHGVIMKILEPRATALVFRSGKIVCTGTRNEHDAYIATRKFARIIQKLGFSVKFLDFKIQNFIATADLRFPVRLEALQQAHGQFSSYEPEIFPGLVYRLVRPRVVLLIFVNGKIVFTGAKTRDEISEALDVIYPILRSYKKN